MMNTSVIEHLDFEPEVPCEAKIATGESADYLIEAAPWVVAMAPELLGRHVTVCREHYEFIQKFAALVAPSMPPPLRIVQVLR